MHRTPGDLFRYDFHGFFRFRNERRQERFAALSVESCVNLAAARIDDGRGQAIIPMLSGERRKARHPDNGDAGPDAEARPATRLQSKE